MAWLEKQIDTIGHGSEVISPLPSLIPSHRAFRASKNEPFLVGVILPHHVTCRRPPGRSPRGLANPTAGLLVVGSLLQKRPQIDIATYIGSGKVEELKASVDAQEADVVLFDNDLGPAQTRNLEKQLGVKVVDRT